jgi:hypothetical protein
LGVVLVMVIGVIPVWLASRLSSDGASLGRG